MPRATVNRKGGMGKYTAVPGEIRSHKNMGEPLMNRAIDMDPLSERKNSIVLNNKRRKHAINCEKDNPAGSLSQGVCVYRGARAVLNTIADAYHIVHGPIGCSGYAGDVRGSLSSAPEIVRNSFCTDMRGQDIIFGGEAKLANAIDEIAGRYKPAVVFVYSTCVTGVIGDDINAVCKAAQERTGVRVIPVHPTGTAGNKASGYRAACDAIMDLIGDAAPPKIKRGLNFFGDFNYTGEQLVVGDYLNEMGVRMHTAITGDITCANLQKAVRAKFNIAQCAGSMHYLARRMEEKFKTPFITVSFYGVEDTVRSLRKIANMTKDKNVIQKTEEFVLQKQEETNKKLASYRERLAGKKAAVYVDSGFKAVSLIKQYMDLGIKTVLVGTQAGREEEYQVVRRITDCEILDNANQFELEAYIRETKADILVGGLKERPLAYKLGVAFLDYNRERKHPLAGFEGALHFAQETVDSINNPVWRLIKEDWGQQREPAKYCESGR